MNQMMTLRMTCRIIIILVFNYQTILLKIRKSVYMSKNKKQGNFLLTIVLIVSILSLAVGGYYLVVAASYQKNKEVATLEQSKNVFKLRKNATSYQRELYESLIDAMKNSPSDQESISTLIAKSYVADFYTWTNKLHFNDVGGLQYIETSLASSVMNQAIQNFYNDFNYYLESGNVKNTLEVESITASSEPTEYILQKQIISAMTGNETQKEIKKDAFAVTLEWNYVPQAGFDTSQYQNKSTIIVVEDDLGVLRIMESNYETE